MSGRVYLKKEYSEAGRAVVRPRSDSAERKEVGLV